MTKKLTLGGLPTTRKECTPAFKTECVRQVSAGARQTDVARARALVLFGHADTYRPVLLALKQALTRSNPLVHANRGSQ